MKRNFKALGLAIVAALALSAMAASAAQADEFTADEYPAILHASQSTQHVFTVPVGRAVKCPKATFTGELTGASTTATISPEYGGEGGTHCTTKIGASEFPTTITFPSTCDYVFKAPTTTGGTADLVCTSGDVEIHVYEGTPHVTGLPPTGNEVCTYTVQAQNNLGAISYKDVAPAVQHEPPSDPLTRPIKTSIEVTANVTGIAYTKIKGTITNCGAGSGNATYTGTSVVEATNEAGDPIGGDIG